MAVSRISLQLHNGAELLVSPDAITHVIPALAAGDLRADCVAIPNPAGGWFILKHTMQEMKQKFKDFANLGVDGIPRRVV